MNDRMRQLEAAWQALQTTQEAVEDPTPVMVHPNWLSYRRRWQDLEQLLLDPEFGSAAMDLNPLHDHRGCGGAARGRMASYPALV